MVAALPAAAAAAAAIAAAAALPDAAAAALPAAALPAAAAAADAAAGALPAAGTGIAIQRGGEASSGTRIPKESNQEGDEPWARRGKRENWEFVHREMNVTIPLSYLELDNQAILSLIISS